MRDGQLSCQLSSLTFGHFGHGASLSLSMTSSGSVPSSESLDGGGDGVGGKWSFVSQEETFWGPVVCIEGIRCRVLLIWWIDAFLNTLILGLGIKLSLASLNICWQVAKKVLSTSVN